VGYQKANVKIVATECGVSQGSLGITHMAVEDMGIMRCIPNVTVVAPADPYQAYLATKAILQQDGAAYMRFGSEPNKRIYEEGASFELGRMNILRRGGAEVALVASGAMVEVALEAARLLSEDGVAAWVADVHTLKPLDAKAIGELARSVRHMLTLEEHVVTGGLGSAVTEVAAAESGRCVIRRLGLPDGYLPVGSRQDLLEYCGLTPEKVRASALAPIRE
jgi:transketolase